MDNIRTADAIRPKSFDDIVGQDHLFGKGGVVRRMIEAGRLPNMIFYGPPGTGKTTAAEIIAKSADMVFHRVNATTATLSDVKDILQSTNHVFCAGGILLYIDEIQYFNKKQQQALLEYIEDGRVTLIASTTENPHFYIYNAIISRSSLFEFKPVEADDIKQAVKRAIDKLQAEMPENKIEFEYIKDNGLLGIKMHPDTQLFNIDDERLFPLYAMAEGKLPIIFHTGDPRYDFSHPARLRRVLDRFPELEVIAAHFGGYSMQDTAYKYLKDTKCYFDISSSLMFMKQGEAEHYINAYGAERMLYGTDFPLWDPVVEVKRFLELQLNASQFDKISHQNALRILKK